MGYQEKLAKKNKIPYIISKKVFLGDMNTYVESTGQGTYRIISPSSSINVDSNGEIHISGSKSVKLGGKNLDFDELPDRYIRPSGVSWSALTTHSKVVAALPIRIKGQKVYIPCLDIDID